MTSKPLEIPGAPFVAVLGSIGQHAEEMIVLGEELPGRHLKENASSASVLKARGLEQRPLLDSAEVEEVLSSEQAT